MQNLWAPWRIEYIMGKRESYCIFCPEGDGQSDEERLILHRGRLCMIMMNKFPYTNGHLLVAPWRHVARLEELQEDEMLELMQLVRLCTLVLKRVMRPDGFNVGLNLGAVAGAGVEDHLHFHVVPRWQGDTNFIAVFADVRSIPEHFKQTYSKLLPHFKKESAHEDV
ncbi:MAG: HIT domain-containing protein [Syntrophobacteraceae bacterium]|nr:HIT domain-containing protein [Desulfobacteraceae bacterium]